MGNHVSVPLRGFGQWKAFVYSCLTNHCYGFRPLAGIWSVERRENWIREALMKLFPSPCGDLVSGKYFELCPQVQGITLFPSPCGDLVSGKGEVRGTGTLF